MWVVILMLLAVNLVYAYDGHIRPAKLLDRNTTSQREEVLVVDKQQSADLVLAAILVTGFLLLALLVMAIRWVILL